MPVTHSGHGRVSLTVSAMLPTSTQLAAPVWLYTCTCTVPALSPGSGPFRLVTFVGNGTVSVVFPLSPVARACPTIVPPLIKFATGGPKPLLSKPPPAIVNDACALARSIGLGLMPVTHSGHGRVSLTVSVMLPTSAQFAEPV